MSEIIRVNESYYILATSALADDRPRVLKQDDTFAIFDHYGDIQPIGLREQGIYHEGTRFLSHLRMRLGEARPLFLKSTVVENNALLAIDLTNPDLHLNGKLSVPRGTLHLFRSKFLWMGCCHERVRISNFGLDAVEVDLAFEFDADFVDIFEVRGEKREHRGRRADPAVSEATASFSYQGLDGVLRKSHLSFQPNPDRVGGRSSAWTLKLAPQAEATVHLTVSCENGRPVGPAIPYDQAFGSATHRLKDEEANECSVRSNNDDFNRWLDRSVSDLRMMVTRLSTGPYPYAGIPWFSTPFGRDGILTALQALWFKPSLAQGVLRFLAATQAKEVEPECDAEPGKILHELRKGEMAALHEIPFGRYYGSVDATPLFVILAGEYFELTDDRDLISEIWPNIDRALRWMDSYGDIDRDGFVEYTRRSSNGLVHQGWKDSQDAVSHVDGTLAEGPIALCEVQAYVYAAKQKAAKLIRALGDEGRARELQQQALALKETFDRTYWCEDLSTYALALDGKKRPCRVRTSNAGHCLFAEIAPSEHGARVAETLLSGDLFSGWGVRTLSSREVRYNPMSYHNGSVWPHDNGIIAWGLSLYGQRERCLQLFEGLFRAAKSFDLQRMPELFCGFTRRAGGPTPYPVACAPQAWSAAAPFSLLRACLGMSFNVEEKRLSLSRPLLSPLIGELEIKNLRLGAASCDLHFRRAADDVGIEVQRHDGSLQVTVVK